MPFCCTTSLDDIEDNMLFDDIKKDKKLHFSESNLDNATWENTEPFKPNVTYGKVIKVYDGDTITIVSQPYKNQPVFRFTLRLRGIDAPELRSRDPEEKIAGKKVQQNLSNLILSKYVHISNIGIDKYGRILCDVYLDDLLVNKWLIDNHYAIEYNGGTKKKVNWYDYMNEDYMTAGKLMR